MPLDLDVPGATTIEVTLDDAEIARLAALPAMAYERERPAAAEKLGCRISILDKLVAAERRGNDASPGQGRAIELFEPEPWPQPIDGGRLLDELAAAIRRHVVLAPAEARAMALWAVGTHAFNAWRVFPRLLVTAPESRCGKTTLLDVLSLTIPRPLAASSITAAALFRVIDAARPSLLLDEADTFARDNEDLRGMLDAGHQRGGAVIRTVGDHHEPRQFSCWAPVALAAIGRLPGTIEDRSIIVRLRRRRRDEAVEALRLDRAGPLDELARGAARWARDHLDALRDADPEMPASLYNRTADNWRPLLAVADLVGGEWPERGRAAAVELTGSESDEGSARVLLLADIRAAFEARGVDRMASEDLVAHLVKLDERPWPEFRGGKPISKAQVARLLKGFGVSSGTVRLGEGRSAPTAKGYHWSAFDDAFARYLPASPPFQNDTPSQPAENNAERDISKRHTWPEADPVCRFQNPANPSNSAGCDGVTFSSPPEGHEGASPAPNSAGRSIEEPDGWTL